MTMNITSGAAARRRDRDDEYTAEENRLADEAFAALTRAAAEDGRR